MSRIGKTPVTVPDGVKVDIQDSRLALEGPKGSAEVPLDPAVKVTFDEGTRQIAVALGDLSGIGVREARTRRAMWGTARKLIANAVAGVTQGYTQQLQVVGVGYAARVEGRTLVLRCGFANELNVPIPDAITADPPEAGNIQISGIGQVPCTTLTFHGVNNQELGQFAAAVRGRRPPEPYKGKGIRYMNEEVKRKAGKALAAGTP